MSNLNGSLICQHKLPLQCQGGICARFNTDLIVYQIVHNHNDDNDEGAHRHTVREWRRKTVDCKWRLHSEQWQGCSWQACKAFLITVRSAARELSPVVEKRQRRHCRQNLTIVDCLTMGTFFLGLAIAIKLPVTSPLSLQVCKRLFVCLSVWPMGHHKWAQWFVFPSKQRSIQILLSTESTHWRAPTSAHLGTVHWKDHRGSARRVMISFSDAIAQRWQNLSHSFFN